MSYQQAEFYLLHMLSTVKLPWLIVLGWSFFASLAGLIIMAADKGRAERGEWRYSEKLLLRIAFFGGCWGVLAGMILFDHKWSKPLFMGLTGGAVVLWFEIFQQMAIAIGPAIPGLHFGG